MVMVLSDSTHLLTRHLKELEIHFMLSEVTNKAFLDLVRRLLRSNRMLRTVILRVRPRCCRGVRVEIEWQLNRLASELAENVVRLSGACKLATLGVLTRMTAYQQLDSHVIASVFALMGYFRPRNGTNHTGDYNTTNGVGIRLGELPSANTTNRVKLTKTLQHLLPSRKVQSISTLVVSDRFPRESIVAVLIARRSSKNGAQSDSPMRNAPNKLVPRRIKAMGRVRRVQSWCGTKCPSCASGASAVGNDWCSIHPPSR